MSNLVLNASFIGDWFYGIWINLWLLIDNVVYLFINWMYRVFILVAKVDIFGGGEEIAAITRRIYIIVGIAMLFIFAYNLILLIVNPDGKQLGNMSQVIKNAIISVALVTLLPLIFSYMTTVQNHIIDGNVIGNLIFGTTSDSNTTNEKAGINVALSIFSAFYHPDGQSYSSCKADPSAHSLCETYVQAYEDALANEKITLFIWNEDLKDGAKSNDMEYNWIISTGAGIFALWMFVSFALDIGVRVGKMAFYELIAPIPVMLRIMPNDKKFNAWFNGIKSTYISLFVRLAIIYFSMYAITLVPTVLSNMWADMSQDNVVLAMLANVVIILGILKFAQEAPKLFKDVFGGSGDVSLGIGSKVKDNKALSKGTGLVRGGVYGATTGEGFGGRVSGFFGGAARGARYGYQDGVNKLEDAREAKENGSTFRGRMADRARYGLGMQTRADAADRNLERQYAAEVEQNEKALIQIQKDRDKENIATRQAYNKEVMGYRSDIKKIADSWAERTNSQFTYDAGDSYTDHNGNNVDIKGNLSQLNQMYESAKANGADAQTLSKLQGAISKAKGNIRNQIVDSVMNGTAESRGIGSNDVAKINGDIESINTMIRDNQVGLKADGTATLTTEVTDAKGVFSGVENAVLEQERDIESVNRNLDRKQQEIERRQKEIENRKKEARASTRYKSVRADADAINHKSGGGSAKK